MGGKRSRYRIAIGLFAVACGGSTTATVAVAPPPPAPIAPQPSAMPIAPPSANEEASNDPAGQVEAKADEFVPPSTKRGWLGVELEPAPDEGGVRISKVVPRSPAETAGLVAGDVILRIEGDATPTPSNVVGAVAGRAPGSVVGVALKRGRADKLASVTLGGAPEADELARMTFVDRPAPTFQELRAAKGTFATTLLGQRGQVVVLEFWAPWCAACRLLIPHLNDWHAQYAARGLRIIGVTTESVPRAAAAAAELGMDYSIASDESQKTMMAYNARAIPAVFAIDRTGTVRDVMVGYDVEHLAKFEQLVKQLIAER